MTDPTDTVKSGPDLQALKERIRMASVRTEDDSPNNKNRQSVVTAESKLINDSMVKSSEVPVDMLQLRMEEDENGEKVLYGIITSTVGQPYKRHFSTASRDVRISIASIVEEEVVMRKSGAISTLEPNQKLPAFSRVFFTTRAGSTTDA